MAESLTPHLYSPADHIVLTVQLQLAIAGLAGVGPPNLPILLGSGTTI